MYFLYQKVGKGVVVDFPMQSIFMRCIVDLQKFKKERWDTETPVEYDSGGGSWFSEIEITDLDINKKIDISFDFNKNISDVNLDITELVNYWKDNSIPNNGLLVKFSDDTKVCGNVKFFSNNTNTIYSPYIAICRFDYIFSPHVNETQKDTKQIDSGSLDSGSLDSDH